MAGHSKWANIKHKKASQDAARNKLFNKLGREIMIAAKEGGGDPDNNPRLSMAIHNAKSNNMPKDNIERALKRGTGELNTGESFIEVTYEGYGPGGVAYFIEGTTDNQNRTVGEIRRILNKYGGKLGTDGSVDYLFEQKGIITVDAQSTDMEQLMLEAIDAGAEDISDEDEVLEIKTPKRDLAVIREQLDQSGYTIKNAEVQRRPFSYVKVNQDHALSNFKLMAELEDSYDISNVFTNMQMDEETLEVAENM